jgi:polygalacturonase
MDESRRAFLWTGALVVPVLLSRTPGIAEASASISVREHGARGDRKTKDTRAIQAAIDNAAASGRTVRFPPGNYLSGTLHLRDQTTLQLDAGAILVASPDDEDFDPPEKLGYKTFADDETSDHSFALLQGREVKRVRIIGAGWIDGNRRKRDGPKPIALKACQGIDIRDLTITNAGNYNVSLLGCKRVNIQDVTILNGYSDGIDPDCCQDVRIARCHIESRDDALCLKASFALGVRRSTENVHVSGCHLTTWHNAIKLGTESTGDFRDIAITDCTVVGKRHPWKGDLTSGLSLEAVDGGILERVTVKNIRMANVRTPIFVRLARRGRGQGVPRPGLLKNISIKDVQARGAREASSITGIPGSQVEAIALQNIKVAVRDGGATSASLNVPELPSRYPDAWMFTDLPAYGLYCRHVAGLRVENVDFSIDKTDARSAVVLDDVRDARVRAVRAMAPAGGGPLVWLHAVRDGELHDLDPRAGRTVARLSGAATARIHLARHEADQDVLVDPDVSATALQMDSGRIATRVR